MDAFPAWFPTARLNYAENALWCKDPHKAAIIATGELQSTPTIISYAELYTKVRQCAKAMRKAGVVKGDRVAGYIANCPEAIIAMLAASSIGAIWSSTSPDFGTIVSAYHHGYYPQRLSLVLEDEPWGKGGHGFYWTAKLPCQTNPNRSGRSGHFEFGNQIILCKPLRADSTFLFFHMDY